jgi:DNA-binding response OmpR family regulator
VTFSETKTDQETILVIDDDPSVRDLMSRFLTKLDFHVVAAANGEEGFRLAKQIRPLLITLDVVMPECDGWTLLNRLKSDSELAEIPVIMVTVVDNEARGLNLGASNYLIKPVERDRLAVLVEKHRVARSTITDANAIPFSYLEDGQVGRKTAGTRVSRTRRN